MAKLQIKGVCQYVNAGTKQQCQKLAQYRHLNSGKGFCHSHMKLLSPVHEGWTFLQRGDALDQIKIYDTLKAEIGHFAAWNAVECFTERAGKGKDAVNPLKPEDVINAYREREARKANSQKTQPQEGEETPGESAGTS